MFKFLIKGVVQGVGFRPYIYNACINANLKGYIKNIGTGVEIVIDDQKKLLEILKKPPLLARIDSIKISKLKTHLHAQNFSIKDSSGQGYAEIPPDLNLCEACLKELNDSENRRSNYFFTTCTNCGPRFSMTFKNPYDRANTTMLDFPMCEDCQREYQDITNRRFHAETTACPNCGPKLALYFNNKKWEGNNELAIIKKTAELIKNGQIVAIKGNGGFHLACRIKKDTIAKLREISNRPHKPYALMGANVVMFKKCCLINKTESEILQSIQRPIVLLRKKSSIKHNQDFSAVSELNNLGAMLPYNGLHYLLFKFLNEPIIMTSANLSGEPITRKREEQFVSDVLDHNRKIANKIDDSVLKVIEHQTLYLRRSRGFVPKSIKVESLFNEQILAVGAKENNTLAVYKQGRIIMSQYLGDTGNWLTLEYFKTQVSKFLQLTNVKPAIILADLHPQYQTAQFAKNFAKINNLKFFPVQHHLAHAYGVALEHNLKNFTAIVIDGSGFGQDGKIWGGEIFSNNQRIAHLEEQILLGNEKAIEDPKRMAFTILRKFFSLQEIHQFNTKYETSEIKVWDKQLQASFNCSSTSSCGRILDAAAFLLGLPSRRTYEGRGAMNLESLALEVKAKQAQFSIPLQLEDNVIKTTPIFQFLVSHFQLEKKVLARAVFDYLARALFQVAKSQQQTIVLGGGVAYNQPMTQYFLTKKVLINREIPAGDGGISFGQIAYYLKTQL